MATQRISRDQIRDAFAGQLRAGGVAYSEAYRQANEHVANLPDEIEVTKNINGEITVTETATGSTVSFGATFEESIKRFVQLNLLPADWLTDTAE
jgi:hypothetical protein